MSLATTLSVSTPSDLEIHVERMFDAPADLVFDCYTTPDLVRRWLNGPDDWSLSTCEIELQPGGNYRYIWSGPDGESMGMVGTFHEIEPPVRLVTTEQFDDDYGMGKMLITTIFHPEGERTRLSQAILFESKAQRDAAVATGMADGMGMSFNSLGSLLADLLGKR